MENNSSIKISGEHELLKHYVVAEEDTAIMMHSGEVEVLATPRLLAMMEETSYLSIKDYLPQGSVSVGIDMHIIHSKASKIRTNITIKSILTKIEGRKLFFEISASDGESEVARGECIRCIVDKKRFMDKVNQ